MFEFQTEWVARFRWLPNSVQEFQQNSQVRHQNASRTSPCEKLNPESSSTGSYDDHCCASSKLLLFRSKNVQTSKLACVPALHVRLLCWWFVWFWNNILESVNTWKAWTLEYDLSVKTFGENFPPQSILPYWQRPNKAMHCNRGTRLSFFREKTKYRWSMIIEYQLRKNMFNN